MPFNGIIANASGPATMPVRRYLQVTNGIEGTHGIEGTNGIEGTSGIEGTHGSIVGSEYACGRSHG